MMDSDKSDDGENVLKHRDTEVQRILEVISYK